MAAELPGDMDELPALHIGFLKQVVDGSVLDDCACVLKTECVPFSKLGTNIDFCNPFEVPRAICFERLGIVIYRPKTILLAASTLFSEVFIETGFESYQAPQVTYTPAKVVSPPKGGETEGVGHTWGLREMEVPGCDFDGDGIRVCIVDSGLEQHPDIALKPGHARSFTQGESTSDELGHGTFNAGIICGARKPQSAPRFGVAPKVELFVAKVFGPAGRACTMSLLASMEWALQNECEIISMSIGESVSGNANPNGYMARAAQRALALGTLTIAGAGNDSDRSRQPPLLRRVSFPANCAGVMAVGALQPSLQMTDTSNVTRNGTGGAVDISAPGLDIQSADIFGGYTTAFGTSVATPHVAGIAALFAQACPKIRGQALWDLVVAKARPLPHLKSDEVGAGIVRAPLTTDDCICEIMPPCM